MVPLQSGPVDAAVLPARIVLFRVIVPVVLSYKPPPELTALLAVMVELFRFNELLPEI